MHSLYDELAEESDPESAQQTARVPAPKSAAVGQEAKKGGGGRGSKDASKGKGDGGKGSGGKGDGGKGDGSKGDVGKGDGGKGDGGEGDGGKGGGGKDGGGKSGGGKGGSKGERKKKSRLPSLSWFRR